MDTKAFSMKIEKLVIEKKIPYMDAIVHYCDNSGMEIETAAKLINTKISMNPKFRQGEI